MEKREIDNCCYFDIEIGCTKDFCTCEIVEEKQETIEEVAEKLYPYALYENDYNALQNRKRVEFIAGAKWQAKRMYSEEEIVRFWKWLNYGFSIRKSLPTEEEFIERFRKIIKNK